MGRLFLLAGILLAAGAVLMAAIGLVQRAARSARSEIALAQPGGALMQKTSFLLLVALIVYVALWGGA